LQSNFKIRLATIIKYRFYRSQWGNKTDIQFGHCQQGMEKFTAEPSNPPTDHGKKRELNNNALKNKKFKTQINNEILRIRNTLLRCRQPF
jgi:hypothetical protein